MNTKKNKRSAQRTGMAARLWGFIMIPVILTILFMWLFQIYFMEKNYIDSSIAEIQELLEPLLEDLGKQDLSENDSLLAALSSAADGKLLIIGEDGSLIALYSYTLPIRLDESAENIRIWEKIQADGSYRNALQGESYALQHKKGGRTVSYEVGVPARYQGQDACLLLYHSFSELNVVLDMNRRQLIALSVLLTLVAARSSPTYPMSCALLCR